MHSRLVRSVWHIDPTREEDKTYCFRTQKIEWIPWFEDLATDLEYVFTDEADAKEVDDCNPRPTAKQKHQLSSVIVLPKNLATVEPEEKFDVEETKNDDMDLRENVTIFSSNNAKQNFRCTTRIEALNIRKNAILEISKVVLGFHRDIKDNASPVPPKAFCGMVAHKLHVSGWNLDKVALDLTSSTPTGDDSNLISPRYRGQWD